MLEGEQSSESSQVMTTLTQQGSLPQQPESIPLWLNGTPSSHHIQPQPDSTSMDYLIYGVRLYKAAMRGDWSTISMIHRQSPSWIHSKITKGGETALHIAAAAKHVEVVRKLVHVMSFDSLAVTNKVGNTALCFAAVSGVVEIAKVMVEKNKELPNIRGSQGMTPLYMAVLLGHRHMVWYLLEVTDDRQLTDEDRIGLLTSSINTDMFDVALHILSKNHKLAYFRDAKKETALHALARKPLTPVAHQLSIWSFRMQWSSINQEKRVEPQLAIRLTQNLWDEIIKLKEEDISNLIGYPWRLLFVAAELGKVDFLTTLIRSYPDLIWKVDENKRTIFHIAIMHRHEKIFQLIYEIGAIKDLLATFKDDHGNNMLHLAGKLAPPHRLNSVSGAALQMQHEILWFKAVRQVVRQEYAEAENEDRKTPHALFSEEHAGLRAAGEQWMKKTAESCALVATLIATVVFSAAFQLPGGVNEAGRATLLKRPSFVVFATSNAVSLFTSIASVLMFLSILTSRYAESDFLMSLPLKLVMGLTLLFVSIATMIIAFTATFFITFNEGVSWAPIPIALIAFVPVALFASFEGDRFVYPPPDPPSMSSHEVQTSEDELDEICNGFKQCSITIKLYQAALSGDCETVQSIWRKDSTWISTRITKGGETVLHIAAAAKHPHLVKELVNVMNDDSLALTNRVGNTALCFAAVSGVVEIAKVMVDKSRTLPNIRGSQDMTPLLMAVLLGHRDMVWYLMSVTDYNLLTVEDGIELLTSAIETNLFEVALHILRNNRNLAIYRGRKKETALHVLARKPLRHDTHQLSIWQKFKMQGCSIHHVEPRVMLELAETLWDEIIKLKHEEISKLICFPWRLLFMAAQLGKVEFLMVLIKSYPDMLWKVDENRYSIFHVAVIHRHEEIFKLIYDIGAIKDLIATYKDDHGNNMLHLASKLAPPNRLNCVSGAALQMQRELLWFEAVKKIVRPEYIEAENKDHKTPQTLFTEEHEGLRKKGEQWMKKTAESCAFVATLIATVVFSAAFQLPGGNDDTGNPTLVKRPCFVVFAMANAISLFTSTASILMFLSILTSRYAERDFLISLPLKLMRGLILLLISIATMIIAFTVTFFITFQNGVRWAPIPVALIASIPVMLFAFQQFPLLVDIYYSTYKSQSMFQPCKPKLFKPPSQQKIPLHRHDDLASRRIDIPFTILVPQASRNHIFSYTRNSFSWHRQDSTIVDPQASDTPSFSSWQNGSLHNYSTN